MVQIGFKKKFVSLVLSGEKKRTMRPVSPKWIGAKCKLDAGQEVLLQIYQGSYHRPASYKMVAAAKINQITYRELGSITETEWQLDGVSGQEEGYAFFNNEYKLSEEELPNFKIVIIEFNLLQTLDNWIG